MVRSKSALNKSDTELREIIYKYVAHESARFKWLDGGIDFIDEIPKSPSGKILRRLLRDMEKKNKSKGIVAKL